MISERQQSDNGVTYKQECIKGTWLLILFMVSLIGINRTYFIGFEKYWCMKRGKMGRKGEELHL